MKQKELPFDPNRVWEQKDIINHLGLSESPPDYRKLDRIFKRENFFPPIMELSQLRDEHDQPLNSMLVKRGVELSRAKRGRYLIVQSWDSPVRGKMLVANDGRSRLCWMFVLPGQQCRDALDLFLKQIDSKERKPIFVFLHGHLAAHRNDLSKYQKIMICVEVYFEKYEFGRFLERPRERDGSRLSHLDTLEAESIFVMREVAAEAKNPVMLYSIGKDSAVMLHIARKAFYPGNPPFPLLHVDTGWKFRAMYEMREMVASQSGIELIVHKNLDGIARGINPIDHGSNLHTDIMKTQSLKQALDEYGFDAAFGGARRDEEKSRAKERIFSFRTASHQWDPKNQRPELWNLYNCRVNDGSSVRVFPLSNWTELDIWNYILKENISIVPLYFAKERPVINRDGVLVLCDDDRLRVEKNEKVLMKSVRFRTLGCYPLTGAIESKAENVEDIILELLTARNSERQGRTIDKDTTSSMEKKKTEGYF